MQRIQMPGAGLSALLCLAFAVAGAAIAEVPVEAPGRTARLALPYGSHWIFVGDVISHRTALVDADDGRMLGTLDSGFGLPQTLHPADRPEIYVLETHYSRGSRGERTDLFTVYDASTLAPIDEIELPPKRAMSATPVAHAALTDDGRFAVIFNLTPATSVTIVDIEERRFVDEIAAPGCSLVYPAGARRFAMLCMDGGMLLVSLEEDGHEASKTRTARFFDPEADPVTEKAVRWNDRWYFPSFDGWIHPVNLEGEEAVFEERWSLVTDAERADDWRIGGYQHLAVHHASGRLFALMHRGGPDSHKDPGSEIWVYDLATQRRIQRIELVNPGFTYLGVPIEGGPTWGWLVDWIGDRIMASVSEIGIDSIAVTQDDDPRLLTTGMFSGGVATYDAMSGEFVGRIFTGNMTNVVLGAPWPPAGSRR